MRTNVLRDRVAAAAAMLLGAALLVSCGSPTPPSTLPSGTAPATSPSPTTPASPTPDPTATTPPPTTAKPPTTKPPTTKPSTATPTTSPATTVPASLIGKDLTTIPTSSKIIALTFDAGANGDAVPSILATLAQEGVTGTFFLTGDFVNEFPGLSQQIAAAGHRIANHTVDHPHLPSLTDAQVRAQVLDAEEDIRAVTGADPRPWFRFPYGDRNDHTIALVNQCGYAAIRWTVDSLGWQGTLGGTRGASFVVDRVVGAATPGGIVLMHVGSHPTDRSTLDADALPGIIAGLRALGYSFVTLDVLLT